jgi:hypothetical protein
MIAISNQNRPDMTAASAVESTPEVMPQFAAVTGASSANFDSTKSPGAR